MINMTLSLPLRTERSQRQCNICLGNTDKGQLILPEWPQASVVKWIHLNMTSHILLGVCSLRDPHLGETFHLIFLRASRGHCMSPFHSPPALYVHWLCQPPLGSVIGRQGHITVSVTLSGGGSTHMQCHTLWSRSKQLKDSVSPLSSFSVPVTITDTHCLDLLPISLYFLCIQDTWILPLALSHY